MKKVTCNLCGADDTRLLFTGTDRDFPENKEVYQIHQCKHCALIYLNPRPDTAEEMAAIYPSEYGSYMKEDQRLLVALRRMAWKPEIREIVRLTDESSPILEIGCATGEFLAGLRAAGRSNLQGLEFSHHAADVARRRHGLDVKRGELLEANFPDRTFDLVMMRHVLEHVSDPRATLTEIRRILKAGGLCIFTIPNPDSQTAQLFRRDWYGHSVPRHFYGFPGRALGRLLSNVGLELVTVKHAYTPNVWIGSVRYWLAARGAGRLGRFFRYENPIALALFAPLGIVSALMRSSGTIRVIVSKRE